MTNKVEHNTNSRLHAQQKLIEVQKKLLTEEHAVNVGPYVKSIEYSIHNNDFGRNCYELYCDGNHGMCNNLPEANQPQMPRMKSAQRNNSPWQPASMATTSWSTELIKTSA